MARFWSSAVGLTLWTKTSISQSESLKNGQFRRIFVISPLFFSTFFFNKKLKNVSCEYDRVNG